MLDLAGTKASVVQLRAEAKDYEDIDAILHDGRIDLPTALAAARAIYGTQFSRGRQSEPSSDGHQGPPGESGARD